MTAVASQPVVKDLQPTELWGFFGQLASIPRPSKKEERVRDWIKSIAAERGWAVREDRVGNIVCTVPATPGCEKAPLTILQSHLDMVCEANSDVKIDFDRDPIRLRIAGEEVRATGTTLGADNGIGVSAALAAATGQDLKHGPLELLFTIDEETGLTGATAISPDLVKGRRLINLDSEEDDIIYIGCAGGRTSELRLSAALTPATPAETAMRLSVAGLCGGHSGGDIHLGRGNSNKVLATTLGRAGFPFRLARFEGGNKHNAIPREATAELLVPKEHAAAVQKLASEAQATARAELPEEDQKITITVAPGTATAAMSAEDSRRVVNTILALPHGVLGLSRAVPGLVETSNNVAVVSWKSTGHEAEVTILASSRSSSATRLQSTIDQVGATGRIAAWRVSTADGYPGWAPNPESKLLAVCRRVYEREFKQAPHVTAIHAGLECGVIGERVGDMDMISFGPTIRGAHSPDERVSIPSVQKFWRYLKAVLAELANG